MSERRLERACLSLDGLSIGDAFGQQFFSPHVAAQAKRSNPPPPPWNYTDDTEMAIALTETLRDCESIDQDFLAQRFVERYQSEPSRGCGYEISAQDTVPFCIWMAAAFLNDYCEAMWTAARVGGDIDTTCAIIGGIVALHVGSSGIPSDWKRNREPLGWTSSRK